MIGSIITVILTAFIFMLVSKTAQRRRIEEDKMGDFIFRLPKYFLFLGIGMLTLTVIFALLIPIKNNDDIFYTIILFSLFGLGGLIITLFYSSYLVKINDQEISFISILRKETNIKWTNIDSIQYKPKQGKLIVRQKNKKINIHQQIIGFNQMLELIEKYSGRTKQDLNIK